MYSIFRGANYIDPALDSTENNARLALDLVLYLQASQSMPEGCWSAHHPGATLRQTTHALEALHLLDWKALTENLEAGKFWLINLSDSPELADEDGETVRRHPSRFKTLAWLREFNDAVVQGEYAALCEAVAEDGVLHGVLADSLLATMILVDTLDCLADEKLQRTWQTMQARALDTIEMQLRNWQNEYATQRNAVEIAENSVTYGLEILINAGRIGPDDALARDVRSYMLASLYKQQFPTPLATDTLYAAIQLATHFGHEPETQAVLDHFFGYIRKKYTEWNFGRETVSFHPLTLRALLTAYRNELVPRMIRNMLMRERQARDFSQQANDQRHYPAFEQLIARRINVDIVNATPLASGLTPADIFRVEYALNMNVYEDGQVATNRLPAPSLVIKVGSHDSLRQAVLRYQSLPEEIKPYFAKQADRHEVFSHAPSAPAYLVLEDLTESFRTLNERLREVDKRRVSLPQNEMIAAIVNVVANALTDIHRRTQVEPDTIVGFQIARLYLARLEEKLLECGQPEHFPVLKSWFRGFAWNDRRFPSIDYYLTQLDRYKDRLQVRRLMLIHGDCHSRNIMLDDSLGQVKLIDVDKIDRYGDYIYDFAQLIEDVAVFQFLFMRDYPFRLAFDAIEFPTKGDEPGVIGNAVEFPAFSSEAVVRTQELLCQRVEAFAQELHDEHWRERLWLALSFHLIRLITKQDEVAVAAVLYAEALRLLHQLVQHLQGKRPLPALPFPAVRPAASSTQPFTAPEQTELAELHSSILELDERVVADAKQNQAIYFIAGQRRPFAVLQAEQQTGQLLLACPAATVQSKVPTATVRDSKSPLRTVISIRQKFDAPALLAALRLAINGDRNAA